MAKLPVYNSQGSITTQTPGNVRELNTYSQGAKLMTSTGSRLQELAIQWQNSKDEVENLDARNKLQAQMTSIIDEANNYNDYSSPAELQAKQDELTQRMNELTPNIIGGFSNNQKAREFESNANLAVQQNNIRLQGIFREKYGDMYNSNLQISADEAIKGFTLTGNEAYKQNYFDAIDTGVKAGYLDHSQATALKLKTDDWNYDYVYSKLLENPYFKASDDVMAKISPTKQRTLQNLQKSQIRTAKADALNSALNDFYVNPTQENLNIVYKLNPKLKGSEKLEDMVTTPANMNTVSSIEGYSDAQVRIKELAYIDTDTIEGKEQYIKVASEIAFEIDKNNKNESGENRISLKDKEKLFNILTKKLSDKNFKEQFRNLPDLKGLKAIELQNKNTYNRVKYWETGKEFNRNYNGNIDLYNRPIVKNSDGSISTVRSMSFNDGEKEVVIPTVSDDGKIWTNEEAIDNYHKTGKHFGKFNSIDEAVKFAQRLHEEQERFYSQKQNNETIKKIQRDETDLEYIKRRTAEAVLDYATVGDFDNAHKAYKAGLEKAIRSKYWYIPELQNENLQAGTKFTVNGKVYTFQGYSSKDMIVEVN